MDKPTTVPVMRVAEMLRAAYEAGAYAADYDEGKIWRRFESDPVPDKPETSADVVARLLNGYRYREGE